MNPSLPFRKTPRDGQAAVFSKLDNRRRMNVQLPTGYGKSFVSAGSYSLYKAAGRVNRLLVIFPTVAQLDQFAADGPGDLKDACVDGPLNVVDISYYGNEALKKHKNNTAQVFAVTIQALIAAKAGGIVCELLQTGRWMITVDEYHHYAFDKKWGTVAKALPAEFLLAMSATPYRYDDKSAFGEPDICVRYRDAVEEKNVVKPLRCHSYVYRIDAVTEYGDIHTYTTDQLVSDVGSDSPDAIEKFRIERKMRWSPKYVSPLVTKPIERMQREQIKTGHRLQALIGAMCVSHAEMVCDQVRAWFPELTVDWVGTGPNGRDEVDNKKILRRFCPPKDSEGRRVFTLDVLVHVGMAGEGLDSVHVSEVIHLNKASINNSNDQENGRAARHLSGITGHINVDSTSEYVRKGYVGDKIMDAMDGSPPSDDENETPEKNNDGDGDFEPLPDEPNIQIWHMELERIDSGDPEVVMYKQMLIHDPNFPSFGFTKADLGNPASEIHALAVEGYRNMRRREAEQHNEKAVITQWSDAVAKALSLVTGHTIRVMTPAGQRVEKSLPGDIKKRINIRKKIVCGELTKDIEVCRKHYLWLKRLDEELLSTKRIPEWLA